MAALGPKVLELPARRSAGSHPDLTTPEHTGQARDLVGGSVFLAPEHKVVLTTDANEARAMGRETVDFYLNLSNYLSNWRRLGFTDDDIAKPGSDKLIDAVVAHGTPEAIAARLNEHLDAGADHVSIQVLGGWDKLIPTLTALAGPLGLKRLAARVWHAIAGHRRRRFHRRQLRTQHGARTPRRVADGARRDDVCRQP